jgi:hypothetical protein
LPSRSILSTNSKASASGKRELPRISAAKLEPLETALVNVARLRSVGGVID